MAESLRADPKIKDKQEKTTATLVFRDFAGINTQSPRESISDQQFAWLENAMPIGSGNMPILSQRGPFVGSYGNLTAPPLYAAQASFNGNDYLFALFQASGFFQLNLTTGAVVQIATAGKFTSQMQIAQWNNQGILIIDPIAGYYDFNVTATGALTQIAGGATGTVGSVTVTTPGSNYTSPPAVAFSGGGFTTVATAISTLGVNTATVASGGGGFFDPEFNKTFGFIYQVGDILTLTGGSFTTAAVLQVTSVTTTGSNSGVITGASIQSIGSYSSVPTGNVKVSPGNASFTINWLVSGVTVQNGGAGYTTAPGVSFTGGGGSGAAGNSTLGSVAGGQVGTSIATYAGRVWIGNGRTVTFTDVAKYNSFGGAGGSLTISDSTLHKNVTQLFTSNGYLYIFGDDSIDILSNVQVVSGSTQFSRVNITTSVGTTFPSSVFSYLRSIVFANNTGFYALSGSTPEKISSALDGLLPFIDFTRPVYGSPTELNGILCASFSFYFTDNFTQQFNGKYRSAIAIFFNGKWFIASQTTTSQVVLSAPINGVYTSFLAENNGNVYPCFTGANAAQAIIQTKLWDFGEPILDKQGLRAGLGAIFDNQQQITCTMDTEYNSYPLNLSLTNQFTVQWINNANQVVQWVNNSNVPVGWSRVDYPSYQLVQGTANAANGKYLGLSLVQNSMATIALFALEYKTGARW